MVGRAPIPSLSTLFFFLAFKTPRPLRIRTQSRNWIRFVGQLQMQKAKTDHHNNNNNTETFLRCELALWRSFYFRRNRYFFLLFLFICVSFFCVEIIRRRADRQTGRDIVAQLVNATQLLGIAQFSIATKTTFPMCRNHTRINLHTNTVNAQQRAGKRGRNTN